MAVMSKADPITIGAGTVNAPGSILVATGVIIYQGAMVGINGSGYARPYVIGDSFAGHAVETVDNSAGANGALRVETHRGVYYATIDLPSGMTQANLGAAVHAVNDNWRDMASSGGTAIAVLSDVRGTKAELRFTTAI